MRYIIIILLSIFFYSYAFPATIHVPADQPTIQAGIDASVNGDTVLVAPGTYVENIDFKGKAITVRGDTGPDVTVIDGNQAGSVVKFESGEGVNSVLDGFTITNGSGTHAMPWGYSGGGIYCEGTSPTITNNTITGNSASYAGGGIFCRDSFPNITNNTISGNTANHGGGIECYNCSPSITNNTIIGNIAIEDAGGISCFNSSPTITSNTITGNTAKSINYYGGGGIRCYWNCSPTITNNTISGNTAADFGLS